MERSRGENHTGAGAGATIGAGAGAGAMVELQMRVPFITAVTGNVLALKERGNTPQRSSLPGFSVLHTAEQLRVWLKMIE